MLKIENVYQYYLLMRMDKPIGTLLLLWPTLWALWIANQGIPPLYLMIIFMAGVYIMRAAGCVINDYADRHVDKHVARTCNRPLTSGKITDKEAISLFIVLCLMALVLVLFLNTLTILLSFVALGLAIIYPFMKRYTFYPQFFLGMAFSWAIPMAFSASTESLPVICWILYMANLFWIIAYDTMYAMVDREDDLKVGIKSTAIAFAKADRWIIFILQSLSLSALLLVGLILHLNFWFYLGWTGALLLCIYQQKLIYNRLPKQCFQAFLNNNWYGLSIFSGLVLAYSF